MHSPIQGISTTAAWAVTGAGLGIICRITAKANSAGTRAARQFEVERYISIVGVRDWRAALAVTNTKTMIAMLPRLTDEC
jgi:hypothetical protein